MLAVTTAVITNPPILTLRKVNQPSPPLSSPSNLLHPHSNSSPLLKAMYLPLHLFKFMVSLTLISLLYRKRTYPISPTSLRTYAPMYPTSTTWNRPQFNSYSNGFKPLRSLSFNSELPTPRSQARLQSLDTGLVCTRSTPAFTTTPAVQQTLSMNYEIGSPRSESRPPIRRSLLISRDCYNQIIQAQPRPSLSILTQSLHSGRISRLEPMTSTSSKVTFPSTSSTLNLLATQTDMDIAYWKLTTSSTPTPTSSASQEDLGYFHLTTPYQS